MPEKPKKDETMPGSGGPHECEPCKKQVASPKPQGAPADKPAELKILTKEEIAQLLRQSSRSGDTQSLPILELKILTPEEEAQMRQAGDVLRQKPTGQTIPISPSAFSDFIKTFEPKAIDDLPEIAAPPQSGETIEYNTQWLKGYSEQLQALAPREEEKRLLINENFVILSPKSSSSKDKGDERVSMAAGAMFVYPEYIILPPNVTKWEISHYLENELTSMAAISDVDLDEAERIARIIRQEKPSVAVVFLYTDEDAAAYGEGWGGKIAELKNWRVFDGFINLTESSGNIACGLYQSRRKHMELSGYTKALGAEEAGKIKEKIEKFYELFDKHLKDWGALILKLKASPEEESLKEAFFEDLKVVYGYFYILYKFRDEKCTSPYEVIFILNILQKYLGTLLNYPFLLEEGCAKDVEIIKNGTVLLRKAIERFMLSLYETDAQAKRNLKIDVFVPVAAPTVPVDLTGEELTPVETPERMGPPEKAILVLTTVDMPKTASADFATSSTRMIEVKMSDTAGLELDLRTSAEKRRFRTQAAPKTRKPSRSQGETLPATRANGDDRAFLDYVIDQIDPNAVRINAALPDAMKAVDFSKTKVVLVVVDVRHSLEQQADILTFLKSAVGATTPIILTVQKGLALDPNIRKQIKELEAERTVSYISDFSIANFILLITTLRRAMRQSIDAINITIPKEATINLNQREALSSFCNKNAENVINWKGLIFHVNDSDSGRRRVPILPLSSEVKEIMSSSNLIAEKFNDLRFRSGNKSFQKILIDLKIFAMHLSDLACLLLVYRKLEMEGEINVPIDYKGINSFSEMLKSVFALRGDVAQLIMEFCGKEAPSDFEVIPE